MTDNHVVVVGGGLAGLVAAATVREHGVDVVVHEAGAEPGGATVESAGWIWRYRDIDTWRRNAPTASAVVTELIHDQLDSELEWLTSLGINPLATATGRASTVGMHVDPRAVVDRLSSAVGSETIVTNSRLTSIAHDELSPVILAAGGYAGDFSRIARECSAAPEVVDAWIRRPRSAARGNGIDMGLHAGGARSHADGQCLVRITLPDPDQVRSLLSAASELLVQHAQLLGSDGAPIIDNGAAGWSGANRLRRFQVEHGTGWIDLAPELLDQHVHSGRIADIVRELEQAAPGVERRANGGVRIQVRAGITHTWCGLDVDRSARVVGASHPLFAAGCDAAGSGHGGTASGLAQALVLGRRAGAAAARVARATDWRPDPT